jgi:hypothetical protein
VHKVPGIKTILFIFTLHIPLLQELSIEDTLVKMSTESLHQNGPRPGPSKVAGRASGYNDCLLGSAWSTWLLLSKVHVIASN